MAFNMSDHYVWDAASVVVDDATHRRASVQAAYNDTAADFHHMVQFGRHALDWLSHNWPGVPYPYEKTTIVQGFAGMEYPMMVNDETYADTIFSRFVAEHEIAHTYFPFYMGINETRYALHGRGLGDDVRVPDRHGRPGEGARRRVLQAVPRERLDRRPVAARGPADHHAGRRAEGSAYGNNAYGKPALGYLAVKDLLGDAAFGKALHAYMDRWHGKHPIPWDFFNTFNDVSGRNLNWFWNAWFFSNSYIDLAVTSVTKTGDGYAVVIDNVGGMPAPVDLVVRYADGTTETVHQTPAIWQANQKRATVAITTKKPAPVARVERWNLDGAPDLDQQPVERQEVDEDFVLSLLGATAACAHGMSEVSPFWRARPSKSPQLTPCSPTKRSHFSPERWLKSEK